MFDPQPWLNPIEGDNPSGVGLRNELRFHDIERLMQPKIDVVRDERNNAVSQSAVPVQWGEVLETAAELSKSGRDLRLLVIVVRALANDSGFGGLRAGLELLAKSIEVFWESLHPELRDSPSPRDAALRRINALIQLESEADGVLGDLAKNVFFSVRLDGQVSGSDLEMAMLDGQTMLRAAAQGLNEKEKAGLLEKHETRIQRVKKACKAYADQEAANWENLRSEANAALAAFAQLEEILGLKLGAEGKASNLPKLGQFLQRVVATVNNSSTIAPESAGNPPPVTNVTSQEPSVGLDSSVTTTGAGAIPDRLNSRGDVIKLLDLIIDFYDRTEPSSPIPHLAKRMRRMVPMDFLALMEEMAPSGLKEFKSLAGVGEDKKG